MSTHPLARPDHLRRRARRLFPRTAVSALALALGLSACAGGTARSPAAVQADQKSAMLLKIADETNAGGDPATAASLYRQLHEQSPRDPVPLARLASIFVTMQDYRAAAEAYRAALALDGDNPDLHRGLAGALLVAGDAQGAMVEARTALAKRSDDPRLYNILGVAQDMVGRHDLAQQSYRHGTDIAPANIGLRNNYAMSLALSGDFGAAVTKLGEIAGPDAPPRYRLNLALAYGLAGDDTKAAATARQVLDEASVQNNLAYYALLRGMDEGRRTAAIIGAELHGTAVTADAAVKSRTTTVAEAQPVPAPIPVPVASSALPPLIPEAGAPPLAAAPAAAAPRHVALADRPAPLKGKAAKPAAAAELASVPPAASSEPADLAPQPPAAAPSADLAAPAPEMPASGPPISLVAPQNSPPTPAAATPAAPDQPPADDAAKTGAAPDSSAAPEAVPAKPDAALAEPPAVGALDAADAPGAVKADAAPKSSAAPEVAPAKPEAASSGPSTDGAPDAEIVVAPGGAVPSSAESAMATQVKAFLDSAAIALPPAPKAEPVVARPGNPPAATTDRFTIQLGSYIFEASAHRIADAFAAKGIIVNITRCNDRDGREWFVARSGDFATLDDATNVLHMLQSMGGAEPIVVRQHRPAADASPAI